MGVQVVCVEGVYIVRLCGRHEIISTVILLNQEGLLSVTSETG